MRHIKYKLFFAWQFDEEEKWLNEMSDNGLQLVATSLFRYEFEESEDKYIYRVEFLENWPSSNKGVQYIQFLEDMGIEHIGSLMRWIYLRKKANEGPFELYSDTDSKIKYFKRLRTLFFALLPLMFANVINMVNLYLRTKSIYSLFTSGFTIIIACLFVTGVLNMNARIKRLQESRDIWE